MKIKQINTHILSSSLETPFAFSQGWVANRSATLIEICTDTGLIGWGRPFVRDWKPANCRRINREHCFAPMLVGANPLDIEKLWFEMYHRSRDFGRKGAVMAAISGIDIALWDIAGQAYGQPVWQLLGGAFRREIEPYATGFTA